MLPYKIPQRLVNDTQKMMEDVLQGPLFLSMEDAHSYKALNMAFKHAGKTCRTTCKTVTVIDGDGTETQYAKITLTTEPVRVYKERNSK